eukprot:746838-Hanusia_phi.AAC.2
MRILYPTKNRDIGILQAELVGAKAGPHKSSDVLKAHESVSRQPGQQPGNQTLELDQSLCKTLSRELNFVLSKRSDKVPTRAGCKLGYR